MAVILQPKETGEQPIPDVYRFGRANQIFRGPRPDLSRPYLAAIGGSDVFGRGIARPFPERVAAELGMTVANWGTPSAGPAFFLRDPVVLEALCCAKLCIVSLMDAHVNPNRLYSVAKRRNARFKGPSEMMSALYPEVAFDRFKHVRAMLMRLHQVSADRFKVVQLELRAAYIARMKDLLDSIETRTVLVWFSRRHPQDPAEDLARRSLGDAPCFVTREMVDAIRPYADVYVELTEDAPQADASAPGEGSHAELAAELSPLLRQMLGRG